MIRWTDPSTGYECAAIERDYVTCGYVQVPEGHPAHGKHYDDVKAQGLTFHGTPIGVDAQGYWLGIDEKCTEKRMQYYVTELAAEIARLA